MRLQAIKLAGFKSFVDPTTVPFPSNLCAVVGPNGCGKSNIIDAVRWVMGESSAKTLRGESMADVIFNGSTSRKPVGQAGIELLFDNAEGQLGGEYAGYSEISIKRQVTRDGQSNYFLNGQKCRRKDITDIFLGTGLGPRSYSIIEQGMISQLIESKPEELRVYIEEAAGISKYKERRRETERRISHTKDNLDRLNDLREEMDRQLHHLERQAKAAERYTALKEEERAIKSQLQALKWRAIDADANDKQSEVDRLQVEQEAKRAELRRLDAEIEKQRALLTEYSDELNEVQRRYYDHGTEIARIEESIQYQTERNQQMNKDLEEVSDSWYKVRADLEADQRKLTELREELRQTEPKKAEISELEEASGSRQLEAEEAMQAWQQAWEEFNQRAADSRQQAEVQQSRIAHLEEAIERLNSRVVSLRDEVAKLQASDVESEIGPLESMLATQQGQIENIEREIHELGEQIQRQREENQSLTEILDEKRSELQSMRGRYASLEALQQAALGQQDDAEMQWLEHHGLAGQERLAERLKVEDKWTLAVETVLGDHLQAVCVDDIDPVARLLPEFGKGSLNFIVPGPASETPGDRATLADKITSDYDLGHVIRDIYVAEDLEAALQMRSQLRSHESVITPEGIWLGAAWLRVSKDPDADAGVLKRQTELEDLGNQIARLKTEVAELTERLESGTAALQAAETERERNQGRLAEQQRTYSETRAQLEAKRLQAEQIKTDIERANAEIDSSASQIEEDEAELKRARNKLQEALDQMEKDTAERAELLEERDRKNRILEEARSKAREDRDAAHDLALKVQSLKSEIASTEQAMERLNEQQRSLAERKQVLEQSLEESEEPQANLKQELDNQLEQRLNVENELGRVRQKSENVEHKIRELEQNRAQVDEQLGQVRETLDQVRMDWQAMEVRRSTIKEQMEQDEQDLDAVLAELPVDADEETWEQNLTRLNNRIQRLGAINLAAIDEYKVARERKQYLDAQNEDLESALDTLESAIRKIDIETRTRFKETFDKVNTKLQQLFPKLFGGGHAYLEMTGEDLLDTGVGLMARPPGKRNSSIHLLSGGEKALTAIAMVFSIFSLNPAPFCLLDEVDAPLDDANVGRYSEMVKEMSRTVQFIFITHNKISMEIADQLMGVTMHEPGVSRLVSVDVDEAVAMAAV